jgi:hypothetical protein
MEVVPTGSQFQPLPMSDPSDSSHSSDPSDLL